MLSNTTVIKTAAIILLTLAGTALKSQPNCCTVTPLPAIPNPGGTVQDAAFFEDGCYAFFVPSVGIITTSYNTQQPCTFNPSVVKNLPFAANGTRMTFISPTSGCKRVIFTDPNLDQLRVFPYSQCQLGNELLTIPSVTQASAIASTATCVAVASRTQPLLQTYSIDAFCNLAPIGNLVLGIGGGVREVVFSSPASICEFLIIVPITQPQQTLLVPRSGCAPLPGSFFFGNTNSNAAAVSPNGKCVAVGYASGGPIQIFEIVAPCSLNLIQTVATGASVQDLEYSPDGSCLAAATSGDSLIFPVNNDCTLDEANVITLPNGGETVSFSPISNCNLIAFDIGGAGVINIFKRTPSALALTKTAQKCEDDKGIFTITVTNNAPITDTNIIVSDFIPAGLKIKKVCAPGWTVNIQGQLITATLPSLAAGATAAPIGVTVEIKCKNGLVGNIASVHSDLCNFAMFNTGAFAALECKSCNKKNRSKN